MTKQKQLREINSILGASSRKALKNLTARPSIINKTVCEMKNHYVKEYLEPINSK
jgi:hypothetical protein